LHQTIVSNVSWGRAVAFFHKARSFSTMALLAARKLLNSRPFGFALREEADIGMMGKPE